MKKKLAAVIALVLPMMLAASLSVSAAQSESWFAAGSSIVVEPISDTPLGEIDTYNIPCIRQTFNRYSIGSWNIEQSGEQTECMHAASYGDISRWGGLLLKGTKTAVHIRPPKGKLYEKFHPVPYSDHIFTTSGNAGNGRESIYIYKDLPKNFSAYKHPATQKLRYYTLTSDPFASENLIKFVTNEPAAMVPLSLSYAKSGNYMLGNHGSYQVIINTETGSARKFGQPIPAYTGSLPKVNTALNTSGSLAMINASDGFDSVLYNLNQCSGVQDGSIIENCQSVRLTNLLKTKIPGFKSVVRAGFSGDSTIYIQARTNSVQGVKESWFRVSLPEQTEKVEYLALGDSFASGEGAYNYRPGTDQADNMCHSSLRSYGYLLKADLNIENAGSVACSGAVQKDISATNPFESSLNEPQAKNKGGEVNNNEILSNYLPGYRRQIDFVEKYKPAVITLSVGGNDIGFADKLKWCILSPQSCYLLHASRASLLTEIKAQFPELVKTYAALKESSPETKIYVIGYPNIVKPDGQCALNVRLTNEEIKLAESMIADLNYVIQKATVKAGAYYVDTSRTFEGYRLCENSSDSSALNGLTLGNDSGFGFKFIGNESFHPNARGHQLFKKTILNKTNSLSVSTPTPDSSVNLTGMPSRLAADASTISLPFTVGFMKEKDLFLKRGTNLLLDVAINTWLEPNTKYRVEVHSIPQVVGTAAALNQDTLRITLTLPPDLPVGPHTLHILGDNVIGEPIDLYKQIVVTADDSDYDGDGIQNQEDNCPFMEPVDDTRDNSGICTVQTTKSSRVDPPQNLLKHKSTFQFRAPSNDNSLTRLLGASPFLPLASTLLKSPLINGQSGLTGSPNRERSSAAAGDSGLATFKGRSAYVFALILFIVGTLLTAARFLHLRKVR